jgi:hypothetical protein
MVSLNFIDDRGEFTFFGLGEALRAIVFLFGDFGRSFINFYEDRFFLSIFF